MGIGGSERTGENAQVFAQTKVGFQCQTQVFLLKLVRFLFLRILAG